MKDEALASPKDAALKLALEALWTTANPKAEEAITAIEAALAQPTSGDYALGYAEGFNDACKPKPAQEPVRWWDEKNDVVYTHCTHESDDYHGFKRTVPLYPHRPPQEII